MGRTTMRVAKSLPAFCWPLQRDAIRLATRFVVRLAWAVVCVTARFSRDGTIMEFIDSSTMVNSNIQ